MTRRICGLLVCISAGLHFTTTASVAAEYPEPPPPPRAYAMPLTAAPQPSAMPPISPMPGMPPMPMMPGMPPMPGFPGGPVGPGLHEPALGLRVGPVQEQVRAQVKLPAGMGLMVEAVGQDGPAEKAGVERFDILRKFDDQLLCSPDQLMALARAAGEGKEVRLTVVHAGQEREVAVKLGNPHAGPNPGRFPGGGGRLQARAQAQARAGAQAGGHARAEAGGGPAGQAGGWQSNQQHHEIHTHREVAEANDRGSVEIQETDGRRTVRVKDAGGREVHAGPLDTEADWQAVPEAFRDMVRSVADKLGG